MMDALLELAARLRPRAVIFDIDSTLSSTKHRSDLTSGEYGGLTDWPTFQGGMVLDAPISHTIDKLKEHAARGESVILLSMRPERFRGPTEAWLRDNDIPFDELYLRPAGDYRPGKTVKEDIFRKKIAPNYVVKTAYDDRVDLVEMWNRVGIDARQVSDPGLPPLEGMPVPDPKYPNRKLLSVEEAREQLKTDAERLKQRASLWDKKRRTSSYYVGPHVRKMKGKTVPVVGYWVDRKMSFSSVDRLAVKLSRREG